MTTIRHANLYPGSILEITEKAWVYWKDTNSVYLGCNILMAQDLNISREDIVGLTDFDLPLQPDDARNFRESDDYVFKNGIPKQIYDAANIGPQTINFLAVKMPRITNDNKLSGIIGISYYLPQEKLNLNPLTPREKQIALHLKRGYTAKKIALILKISHRTVEHHVENIRRKLGASSKVHLLEILHTL